jgi:nitrogen fixation/metabolism regulation signal transduction histidine kinase
MEINEAMRVARHDFKTPLTSLRMLAQLIKLSFDKGTLMTQPERTERNCRLLVEQVDKLTCMADVLFEITRIQAGELRNGKQPTDLRAVIESAAVQCREIKFELSLPEHSVMVEAPTEKLVQAIKWLFCIGKPAKVELSTEEGSAKIRILGVPKVQTENESPILFVARVTLEALGGVFSVQDGEADAVYSLRIPIKDTAQGSIKTGSTFSGSTQ